MTLIFGNQKKKLKEYNYLDLTPYKRFKEEINQDGIVNIIIPKFSSKFAAKYIVPKLKSPNIKLKLDEIGSGTWLLIDGEKKVATIAEALQLKFGDKIDPVNQRLATFLTQLFKQKFISFKEFQEKEIKNG
jgi:hypothetical protein